MKHEWNINAQELARSLADDFQFGQILDERSLRSLTEGLVENLMGLRIEIFSNEHPPPHFRVIYVGETANFTIKDCTKLNGGLKKWERNIRAWHSKNKPKLIEVWNRTRPFNCPVGEYQD